MIHFHPLTVRKVTRETEDCVSLEFEVPEELVPAFQFVAGQNLTVRRPEAGEDVRRTYSICSAPGEGRLCIAVKRVPGGRFSSWANEAIRPGDQLEVMPPTGNFYTPLDPAHRKNYVAVAAGSGITPVLSLIKATLQTEPESRFTLVYGNRTRASIIFREALEAIKDRYIDRFRIYHILSREPSDFPLQEGRIDGPKLKLLFDKLIDPATTDEFFLCGPEALIFTARQALLDRGVPQERIHFELFTVPGQPTANPDGPQEPAHPSGPVARVEIRLDGNRLLFDLPFEGESLLDAALHQGADLPYSCKGGVCTTCRARLLEGAVRMDVNWGLEADEVEKGYILTCQSHPLTDRLVVDFDAK